jgi:hypothetical protein
MVISLILGGNPQVHALCTHPLEACDPGATQPRLLLSHQSTQVIHFS